MSMTTYDPAARDSVEHWILLNKVDRENPRPGEQWLAVHYVTDVDTLVGENVLLREALEHLSRVVINETEGHTFGSSGYDLTLDHLHDEAVVARAALGSTP